MCCYCGLLFDMIDFLMYEMLFYVDLCVCVVVFFVYDILVCVLNICGKIMFV